MKSEICSVCLKSGMLCRTCREKVEKGLISDTDIRVSRILHELSEHVMALKDVTLKKVVESEGLLVIMFGRGDAAKMIGKSGLVARRLEKEMGKRVSIVEEARDVKEFISNMLHPVPIVGVNVLYRKGAEVLRVLVPENSVSRVPGRNLKEIVRMLYGKDVEIAGA